MIFVKKDIPYFIETSVIDFNGDFVNSLTVTYEIRESDTNALFESGTMIQADNIYKKEITFTSSIQYRIFYITPSGYENGQETLVAYDADFNDISEILQKVCEILGLSQSNFRMTNHTYNSSGCLVSALITTYPTATDTDNRTNPIAQYNVTATYDGSGKLIDYKVTKV